MSLYRPDQDAFLRILASFSLEFLCNSLMLAFSQFFVETKPSVLQTFSFYNPRIETNAWCSCRAIFTLLF